MKIGLTSMDDNNKDFSRRNIPVSQIEDSTIKLHTDLSILSLLVFMILAAVAGGHFYSVSNKPSNVLSRSINKSLKQTFKASIEGSITLKDSTLSTFRSRQVYSPEKGLSVLFYTRSAEQSPFDAVSAVESLRNAENITEYEKEDMYGYPARHFSGTFNLEGDNDSTAHVFEYWVNMRSLLSVRINIAKVERNILTDSKGDTFSKETYLNIRYYDWQ